MDWVNIKSRKIKLARYNERSRRLDVTLSNGRVVEHMDIAPHVFRGLLESPEPSFYYRYYIKPTAVRSAAGHAQAPVRRVVLVVTAFCVVGLALVLISSRFGGL
ncbi:KTSC domain-containing protein [Rhizobiaceae bacterium BDR2-2]|uniref:KTSC domain-containing protein n=1 Tax=Ectorhizobium quercum TaxID=2965071 RepID=A0AAE3N2I1_9HYPH|nr:KTSC domain-containing protein [Ectorhizobium quercum]MCX8998085.1 KTSC domain-containing protein [Ectorhizobium quercum]